jgi:hypothetical protein
MLFSGLLEFIPIFRYEMRILTVIILILFLQNVTYGQPEEKRYLSDFKTADTSIHIELKTADRHGLWKLHCYKYRNSEVNISHVSDNERDSLQKFFISTLDGIVESKLLERLYLSLITVFNENEVSVQDTLLDLKVALKCNSVHYDFQCLFMFDDSLWFPLHIYLNTDGKLMHQSSILETLSSLKSYAPLPRTEAFAKVYDHRNFSQHPVYRKFEMHYSEKQKLFYYEFMASKGKEIERTTASLTTKINHIFIDAFTGKILWKPALVHQHDLGRNCTTWNNIYMPKNKLVGR